MAASRRESPKERLVREARERGDSLRRKLIRNKQLVPLGEFLRASRMTPKTLKKASKAGRIFAFEVDGQPYYPSFFLDPILNRRRLENVARILADDSTWDRWLFFTTPKASLRRRTPIEAMRQGEYALVRKAAAARSER